MPHALLVDDDVNFVLGLAEVVGPRRVHHEGRAHLKEARAEIGRAMPDIVPRRPAPARRHGPRSLPRPRGQLPPPRSCSSPARPAWTRPSEADAQGGLRLPGEARWTSRACAPCSRTSCRTRELKEQIGSLRGELRKLGRFGPLIGASPVMQRVYDMISKVAPTDATVLLLGETGRARS
jgi:hypothetical protein